ncbi:unnamed protein product [Clavelina lepadiformis]|uniref:Peptidase M14 domain-containing protein n=1 Tax=Clavelina lepadiformis TaxID=159417 RepID=A0ABP0EZS5_CLALP
MPSMNPDGYKIAKRWVGRHWSIGRYNWNGRDLNRDFPDLTDFVKPYLLKQQNNVKKAPDDAILPVNNNNVSTKSQKEWGWTQECNRITLKNANFLQAETKAVMRWIFSLPFVLSITFHDGGFGAVYPFDKRFTSRWYTPTPDNEIFLHLAKTYSTTHGDMSDRTKSGTDRNCFRLDGDFRWLGGIVNGATWFSFAGGLEDFSYITTDCFGFVVELSCTKWLSITRLRVEWEKNREAMLTAVEQTHIGFKGVIRHSRTNQPLKGAVVHVVGYPKDVTTYKDGDYWRPMQPGTYQVYARHGTATSGVKTIRVHNNRTVLQGALQIDFYLY